MIIITKVLGWYLKVKKLITTARNIVDFNEQNESISKVLLVKT